MSLLRAAGVVLVAVALAGCGVPTEPEPRAVVPPDGVTWSTVSPAPSADPSGDVDERLYFVQDGRLLAVLRQVSSPSPPDQLLRSLLAGPSDAELDEGIGSALTGAEAVEAVRVTGGEAVVELGDSLTEAGRTDQVLAFGQIVCTLTVRPDVDRVSFLRDGERVGIPRADGSLSQAPLTEDDYRSLLVGG